MLRTKERDWQAINLAEVERQLAKSELLNRSACGCKMPIHTFRIPGEFLEGRLRPCHHHDRADRARAAHLHIPTKNKEISVAIRLSKMLWVAIENNHLWGHYVKITYKGSAPTKFGHAKKLYLVEVDKGSITENFESVRMTDGTSKKPRKKNK